MCKDPAEKALKALIMSLGGEPWGHSITSLAEALPNTLQLPDTIREAANRLTNITFRRAIQMALRQDIRANYTHGARQRGQFRMQGASSNSAGATYLDKDRRLGDLHRMAAAARGRMPEIQRVILFGSHAAGIATPRSDADVLVVVESSRHEHPRDRIPEMLRALSPMPCPIDLFVLTSCEFERYRSGRSPVVQAAIATGIDLLQEPRLDAASEQ